MGFEDITYHMAHSGYEPKEKKEEAMTALLLGDYENETLQTEVAEEPLVRYLKNERQVARVLDVVDRHKNNKVFNALLMVNWNIDRKGEKTVFDYYKANKQLACESIQTNLELWVNGPDRRLTETVGCAQYAGTVWFQMYEMISFVARLKPKNCNKILLQLVNDERLAVWFRAHIAKTLGKLKIYEASNTIIELLPKWDNVDALIDLVESLKDIRAYDSLPILNQLRKNIENLLDVDDMAIGDWANSESTVSDALQLLVPRSENAAIEVKGLAQTEITRKVIKLKKMTAKAIDILEK